MKTTIVEVTKNIVTIEAAADMFIIPNHSILLENPRNMSDINRIKMIKNVMMANDKLWDFNTDPVMQLWFTSEDLASENIGDHGFRFSKNSGNPVDPMYRVMCSDSKILNQLPKKLFSDLTEGDSKTIKIPMPRTQVFCSAEYDEIEMDIELLLTVTAAQTKYRYRNFGSFQQVMNQV